MNLRLPPSSALSSSTACPVVPEPAKKSRTMSLGWVACASRPLMSEAGLA